MACTPVTAESGSACEFSKAYSTDEFLSTTTFDVKATDTKDNVGEYQHAVSRDDQAPAQIITYPEGTSMNYVNVNRRWRKVYVRRGLHARYLYIRQCSVE